MFSRRILLGLMFCAWGPSVHCGDAQETCDVAVDEACVDLCDSSFGCVSDLDQNSCSAIASDQFLIFGATVCDCCPGCKTFIPYGTSAACSTTGNKICAPGLKCDPPTCEVDTTSCLFASHLQGKPEEPMFIPSCLPDGTYAPVQCKGEELSGRCFCTSPEGKRLFGWQWYSDASNMTCACSIRRAALEKAGRNDVTLHCDEHGSYEPLQCDSKMCWCADRETGDPVRNIAVVPESMMRQLPCYYAADIGSQYLRQCESQSHAQAIITNTLAQHGTEENSMVWVFCDYDGSYGHFQLESGVVYCSWKDSSRIGPWQAEAGANVALINCNCARDYKIFGEAGIPMTMTCTGDGTYRSQQEHNGQLFCVDQDGFAISPLQPLGVTIDCDDYLQYVPK